MVEDYIIKPDNEKFNKMVLGVYYHNIVQIIPLFWIFIKEEGKSFFVDKRRENKTIKSIDYDKIIIDNNNPDIIYCYLDNIIKIYLRNRELYMAELPLCNLSFLGISEGNFFFAKYDNINEKKLISINSKNGVVTNYGEEVYSNIKMIFNLDSKIFLLSDGKYSKLLKLIKQDNEFIMKIDFKNILQANYYEDDKTLIYATGIIAQNNDKKIESINNLDSIEKLNYGFYIVKKNNNEGLWFTPYGLVQKIEDGNKIKLVTKQDSFYMFLVNNILESYLIKIYVQDNKVYKSVSKVFNKGVVINNLIVFKNGNYTVIYNSYGNEVLKFNKDVRIKYIPAKEYREYEVYKIDGEYYRYDRKKLIHLSFNKKDLFIAGVRTLLGDIAINEYDSDDFYELCNYFNNKDNEVEIGDILLKLYTSKVEEKYPNLVRRIK